MPRLGLGLGLSSKTFIAISSVVPSPPLWTPSEISTIFWYDAADESTITATGNQVTQMLDKSGNVVTLSAITGGKIGPDTGTRTLNGLNVLEWRKTTVPTNQILENNSFNQAQPFCIAIVMEFDDDALADQDFLFSGTESSSPRIAVRRTLLSGETGNGLQILTNAGSIETPSGSVTEGNNYLASFYFNTTQSTIRLNGTPSAGPGSIANNSFTSLNIGGNFNEDQSLDGFIAEVLAFADPNDQEIVEGYLAWKWGMQDKLPPGHPYKNSPPTSTPTYTPTLLSVYRDTDPYGADSLFGIYAGPTVTVENMEPDACDPVRLVGGSAVTDLAFNSCSLSGPGTFRINDLSQFQGNSLTSVSFSYCGYNNFELTNLTNCPSLVSLSFSSCGHAISLSNFSLTNISNCPSLTNLTFSNCGYKNFSLDTSGLTSLTNLTFSFCGYTGTFSLDTSGLISLTNLSFNGIGYYGFSLPDTSSLTNLTILSFSYCGYLGAFSLPDTSSLTNLTSLSFSNCGYSSFSLPTTSGALGTLASLTSLTITDCGPIGLGDEAQALLILETLDAAGNTNGTVTINNLAGVSTLATVRGNLLDKGWVVCINGDCGDPTASPDLSLYSNETLINTYTGETNVTVDGSLLGLYSGSSALRLADGAAVTDLAFQDLSRYYGDTLDLDTSTFPGTSLTSVSFSYCGYSGFTLSNSSGFTNATSISFTSCGQYGFSITDTSGFDSLTSFTISSVAHYSGTLSIIDTTSVINEVIALVILEGIDNGTNISSNVTINIKVTGTSSLGTVISNLQTKYGAGNITVST